MHIYSKQYKELRAEYLKIKKDRMTALKQTLSAHQLRMETGTGQTEEPQPIGDIVQSSSAFKPARRRNRKRKRPSGKERVSFHSELNCLNYF